MLTALNLVKLTILLGSGFLYFIGLGWIIMGILLKPAAGLSPYRDRPLIDLLPLLLTTGLIVNYGISLLAQHLSLGLFIGASISVIGLWNLGYRYFKHQSSKSFLESPGKWVGASLLFVLYLVPILFEPLDIWDARSIWFFHAKMIFTAGSFGVSAGWQHPSVIFSHVDYPNLLPGIAAQIAHVLGFWNEYIPKASLAFILLPALMWLFSFKRSSFSFLILIFLPLSLSIWLWNGYMDGYLALYFAISTLLIGRYIKQEDSLDLISSIICLVLLMYIKNEGLMAFIAGAICLLITMYMRRNKPDTFIHNHPTWRQVITITFVLLPFGLWNLYKYQWQISNDLEIGTIQSFSTFLERLENTSYISIFQLTYEQIESALLLLGLSIFASIAQKIKIPGVVLHILFTSSIYYTGIFLIYMITPHNLEWHLFTSSNRTILSVHGIILVACYYILDSLERHMDHNDVAPTQNEP